MEDDPINANSSHSSSGLHGRFSSHCDIITQETRSVLCNSHDGQKLKRFFQVFSPVEKQISTASLRSVWPLTDGCHIWKLFIKPIYDDLNIKIKVYV